MDDTSFRVEPDQLTDASRKHATFSDDLGQARDNVRLTLPSEAFGQLPESAELAAALEHSVQLSTDALDQAATVATNIGTGLATCARNYSGLDATHAGRINGVLRQPV